MPFISTYFLGMLLSVKFTNLKIPMPLGLPKSFPWAYPISFRLIPFSWSTHATQLLRLVLPSKASFSGQLGRPPCNIHGSPGLPGAVPCNTSAPAALPVSKPVSPFGSPTRLLFPAWWKFSILSTFPTWRELTCSALGLSLPMLGYQLHSVFIYSGDSGVMSSRVKACGHFPRNLSLFFYSPPKYFEHRIKMT